MTTKKRTPRMSETRLISLAREYDELGRDVSALNAKRGEVKDMLVKEMAKRKVKAIEAGGVRLNIASPTSTRIDWDEFKRKIGSQKWRSVCDLVPSKQKVAEAIQDGKIKPKTLADCTEQTTGSSYPVISYLGD